MAQIFLDTYAIFELIKGNLRYKEYQKEFRYLTTVFNLTELYYNLRRIGQTKNTSNNYFFKFSEFMITITPEILIDAGEFKLQHKKKKLSYADCIGYIAAKRMGVAFLTGDEAFEKMDNVIFVK